MNEGRAARHSLTFGFPAPLAERSPDGFVWRWSGVAVMGVVNLTPDSFSDGGRLSSVNAAVRHAETLVAEGAQILDLGGESTRPGAEPVSAEVELGRVLPVLRALRGVNAVLSVDTYKPEVAAAALEAGAHLVNDVTGFRDPEMARVCAAAGAPAVLMHMQGLPGTMQNAPQYENVALEVRTFLADAATRALGAGVPSVMLDPGVGFGKTLAHNLALLRALPDLAALGPPVLLGASRKGLIRALAGESRPEGRDPGSLALHLWGAQQGVATVRVHNVAAHVQALRVWEAIGG